jgi:predicted transcriptional regulator
MRKIMSADELYKWYLDKNVRVWRRALHLLYEEGPLSLYKIAMFLDSDPSGTERQLKKMAIDRWVKRENHKWDTTDIGNNKVLSYQKYGSMPTRRWGRYQ